ncbi:MAG: DUF2802 domain-containing protein [Gammaproteobacteria bacterium]
MPQIPYIPLDFALLAGRALFLVFAFVLATITFTRWRRATDALASAQAERFAEHSTALLTRLNDIEETLAITRRRVEEISERLDGEGRRAVPAGASAPSYQIAIRLARSGAPREELMASCGLTRQEAQLVQRLHAPARQPKLAAAS